MHPNWKAISTVYIKHQPFVTEKAVERTVQSEQKPTPNALLNGAEISCFYEKIINLAPQSQKAKKKTVDIKFKSNDFSRAPTRLNFNQFCAAVMQNNGTIVEETCRNSPHMINQVDQFNWTPVMMAACEGATESFAILLKYNCDINTTDRKGNSVYSLAKKRNHDHILALLMQYFKSNTVEETDVGDPGVQTDFYCELCKYKFKESTKKEHITSTLHQFNLEHHKFPIRFGIDEHNRGFQLMLKQGWNKESGLGHKQCGTLFPVKTQIREFRSGLGIQQKTSERVTHFKPYDLAAIKRNNIQPRAMTKRDLERLAKRDRYNEQKIRKSLS